MTLIINPGSENKGGTLEEATKIAESFLKGCKEEGIEDVEFKHVEDNTTENFVFVFTHAVTGVEVELKTHGFSPEQRDKFIFSPRVYWNGSSTANPQISDFLREGYSFRVQYFKTEQ